MSTIHGGGTHHEIFVAPSHLSSIPSIVKVDIAPEFATDAVIRSATSSIERYEELSSSTRDSKADIGLVGSPIRW
jgi:hypothetical protein